MRNTNTHKKIQKLEAERELNKLWLFLDNASGSMYNAVEVIDYFEKNTGVALPKEDLISKELERIDISAIDGLKQTVESLIYLVRGEIEIEKIKE